MKANKLTFEQAVEIRIAQLGLLHKFVAKKINISAVSFSHFLSERRVMPAKVKKDLTKYLSLQDI